MVKGMVDDACASGFCEQLGAEAEQPSGGDVKFQVYLAIPFCCIFLISLLRGQALHHNPHIFLRNFYQQVLNGFTMHSIYHLFDDPGA